MFRVSWGTVLLQLHDLAHVSGGGGDDHDHDDDHNNFVLSASMVL